VGEHRDFKCGVHIDHSKSQPTDDKLFMQQPRNKKPIVIWEEPRCHPSRQRITMSQSHHWLQRDAPHLHQNCPFPSPISTPNLMHPSLSDRTHHPKRHPDPISRFATIHQFSDRQTDIPTYTQIGDNSIARALTHDYINSERRAKKTSQCAHGQPVQSVNDGIR